MRDRSNAIVAISNLSDMMAIEGAIASPDAIGCQRNGAAWDDDFLAAIVTA